MKRFDLKDTYALVTGASSGIGKEISRCLAEEGAHMVLGSLPAEKDLLEQWAAELKERYRVETWTVPVDLAEDSGPEELYKSARKLVPHLDVLVNNAGILSYGIFQDVPLDTHDRLLRINTRAYMLLMHLVLPEMIARGKGRILNVSSLAAFQATSYQASYGASKAFVQSLSEAVNLEIQGTGVFISTLNPNLTDTPMITAYPKESKVTKLCKTRGPALTARKGVDALKKGKPISIPGPENWLVAHVFPRFFPRAWINGMSYMIFSK